MFNSLIVLAVAGALSANVPESPQWQSEYRAARTRAMEQKKPLAVFIGAGQGGFSQVMSEGTLDGQINGMLAKGYICLYADVDTESGKALAGALEIGQKSGLVISDAAGRYQAFSHEGTMKPTELTQTLVKFAEADRPVVKTEVINPPAAMAAPVMMSAPVMSAPAMMIPQTATIVNQAPTMTYIRNGRYYTMPSSSCPNGNCPTAAPYCPTGNCPNR